MEHTKMGRGKVNVRWRRQDVGFTLMYFKIFLSFSVIEFHSQGFELVCVKVTLLKLFKTYQPFLEVLLSHFGDTLDNIVNNCIILPPFQNR